MTIIVDASVAAKWLFQEPETDKARALLGEVRTGKLSMLAPELLPVSFEFEPDREHACLAIVASTRANGSAHRNVIDRELVLTAEFEEV